MLLPSEVADAVQEVKMILKMADLEFKPTKNRKYANGTIQYYRLTVDRHWWRSPVNRDECGCFTEAMGLAKLLNFYIQKRSDRQLFDLVSSSWLKMTEWIVDCINEEDRPDDEESIVAMKLLELFAETERAMR